MTLNYRLCLCTMSMGPLTARGDPQTLPLLPLTLRSGGRQTPQPAGTLISLSLKSTLSLALSPSSSLPSRRASSVAPSQLAAALIPVKPGPPRPALSGSPRLPGSSHSPSWLERARYRRRLQDAATLESIRLGA